MSQLSPPYPLIRDALEKGRVIPFLGAGASSGKRPTGASWCHGEPAYLPNAIELANHLAEKTKFPQEERERELTKIAQYFEVVGGRTLLNDELHGIFDCDYPVGSLHNFLAKVSAKLLIVTTNYDDCLERAFRAEGVAFDLVTQTTDPRFGDQLLWLEHGKSEPRLFSPNKLYIDLNAVHVIYKIHGAIDRTFAARDQYVITEDDYVDFLTRIMRNKAIPAIFREPFLTRHFLFLGYSLRDWNLRVVLKRIGNDLRRQSAPKSWSIRDNPSSVEQRFWQERGVEVYDKLVDDFIKELVMA